MGIKAYALVGFFIISVLFTQYAFAQFEGCGPDEIRNVEGECVSAFGDEPSGSTISVETDRSSYSEGDTIRISGNVEIIESDIPVPVTIILVDSTGNIVAMSQVMPNSAGDYSHSIIAGGTMEDSGTYEVIAQYGTQKALTTFVFGGTTGFAACGPNEIRNVEGECVYAFVDEPSGGTLSVKTDRSSYNDGDIIRITGSISSLNENYEVPVTILVVNSIGDIISVIQVMPNSAGDYSYSISAGGSMKESGTYEVRVQYGAQKSTTTFSFSAGGFTPTPTPFDTTPPLLLTPSDMTIDATDSSGARVDYSVKAIDDNDGVLKPRCSPSSGAFFKIGNTGVTCLATDNSGNSVRKSFLITVNPPDVVIPSWVRDVAEFWCGDEIDDSSFIEAIEYLIDNDVIIVPTTASSGTGAEEIPNWIKSNACWWSQGLISNSDFASGLQYLIGQGIIKV